MSIVRRGLHYHLRKRVPRRFKRVEPRETVWLALNTDSRIIADNKAPRIWADMIEAWEAALAGDTGDAERRFEAARELAKVRGFRFMSVDRVASLPLDDLLERVEAVKAHGRTPKARKIEAAAVLGGATPPPVTVNRALVLFWTLAEDRTRGKSADQVRRWKNPRIKAVKNFIAAVGDIPLEQITPDDMLDFREWWWQRIKDEDLTPNSANKDFAHLGNILRTVNRSKRLGLSLPLEGLAFKEGTKNQRPAFSPDWIRDKILAPGAFDGLNLEARSIVLGMVNTGYRPSEAQGLLPEHIRLDDKVPHICIEPVGRALKSHYSRRRIPLAGVSLEAFKACPQGFPRYRDKPGLSATVNKFMRENGLCESDDHTLYGLRHSFEDRMIAAGVDDRIRRDLFGHRLDRERYGSGPTLEHLAKVVGRFAF